MSTTNWWQDEAWKQLKRVKELEDENALLRHRLKAIGREANTGEVNITVERFMGRTWYSLDPQPSSALQDPQIEIAELARPIGSTDDHASDTCTCDHYTWHEPTCKCCNRQWGFTHDGVRADKAIHPRTGRSTP